MRYFIGYVKANTGDIVEFYFEVPDHASRLDIDEAAVNTVFDSGLIEIWWEEVPK